MCINDVKKIIVEILDKKQGITLLELYDIFVREYNGTLKVNDKKFEDILDDLLRENKIKKVYSNVKKEDVYYNIYLKNVKIPFFGRPGSCYHCRFGLTEYDIEKMDDDPNEYEKLSKKKYACLLDPELDITSDEFGRFWNNKPQKCPFNKTEE